MSDKSQASLLSTLGGGLVDMQVADVGKAREKLRTKRFVKLAYVVWAVLTAIVWREVLKSPDASLIPLPHIDPLFIFPALLILVLIVTMYGQIGVTGRSPHTVYRADQIDTRLDDVVGVDGVKEEAIRSLNLFLAHRTFAEEMGGKARRGILFEGPPGTGKTHLARAMAAEAGVPFLFASGTSFVSSYQGASSRKVRSYFKALRKAAKAEGGAIGFVEEIDVIAGARSGVSQATAINQYVSLPGTGALSCSGTLNLPATYASPASTLITNGFGNSDTSSIVNELLVQMQSFDALTTGQKVQSWFTQRLNLFMPASRQFASPKAEIPNILIIAATNRASSLDPALLRPGRFDRKIAFELPAKSARRQLIDFFLAKKNHHDELATDERRDALAATTIGYSPAMLENLLDEALVFAVRRGDSSMTWADVEHARMTIEVGVGQPVDYTDHERALIATHEAGHATLAWLTAPGRRLEILTIIKRKGALGMLAHGDREDVYTRSRSEMEALIQIAMGGQCAEEIFFGDISTGPGGDLLYATNTAAEMVGAHGMEGSLISFMAVQNSGFSDTNIVGRVLADEQGRQAVDELLHKHKSRARELLIENRHLVEALRDALLSRQELIGNEITDVLETAAAARPESLPAAPRTIDLRDASEVATA